MLYLKYFAHEFFEHPHEKTIQAGNKLFLLTGELLS